MSPDLSFPRRLHPAEIALAALDNLREVVLAAVVGLLVGGGVGGMSPLLALAVGLGGVALAAAAGYVRWANTTYRVAGGALHFRHGILSPDETTIPVARIQAIDATQGPIQRLFGVEELHVQTAGGGSGGEIVLRAVSDAAAHELRAVAGIPDPQAAGPLEWRLGAGALLLTALTAPQIGVILPLVGGLVAAGDNVLFGQSGERLIDRLPSDAVGIALIVAALAGAAFLISFLGAIVAFSGFVLVRDGDRLRIRRGLLQRRAASIPLARVHGVDVVESPLRRPFGLGTIRVETAGYRSEPAAAQTLVPLLPTSNAPALLREFVPGLAASGGPLRSPPRRARRRYALPGALAGGLVGGVVTAIWPWAWPIIPALAVLGGLEGLLRWGAAGWRLDGRRIVVRERILARRTLIARADRLQQHELSVSPFQRRGRLASFAFAVGSGRRGRVRHLDRTVAGSLFERLRQRASPSGEFPPVAKSLRGEAERTGEHMGLGSYKLNASVAVSDMAVAQEFYEGKLGLAAVQAGADGSRIYGTGDGAGLHVYPSPGRAGESSATLATWYVDDVERMVDELTSKGVAFERYDEVVADDRGISPRAGGGKVAWFKDPDGNTFAIEGS